MGVDLPIIKVKIKEIENGIHLLDFLSSNNITSSKSEARRIIANNGLRINNILVNDDKRILKLNDFKDKFLKISFGKKKHYQIKII